MIPSHASLPLDEVDSLMDRMRVEYLPVSKRSRGKPIDPGTAGRLMREAFSGIEDELAEHARQTWGRWR